MQFLDAITSSLFYSQKKDEEKLTLKKNALGSYKKL